MSNLVGGCGWGYCQGLKANSWEPLLTGSKVSVDVAIDVVNGKFGWVLMVKGMDVSSVFAIGYCFDDLFSVEAAVAKAILVGCCLLEIWELPMLKLTFVFRLGSPRDGEGSPSSARDPISIIVDDSENHGDESTEYLRGGIEYSDRIRVHASRPEQIGGVGYRSHISHQVA
ncbi:hypothetical protein ACOSQ3_027803 [Xanthoceras sorbifolium]